MYLFAYFATATCLIVNTDARSVEERDRGRGYERKNPLRKASRDISEANANADTYIAECKCVDGFCEKDDKGQPFCKCPPEWGLYRDTKCERCNCGEEVNCSFSKRFFWPEKTCFCKDGYVEDGGVCKDKSAETSSFGPISTSSLSTTVENGTRNNWRTSQTFDKFSTPARTTGDENGSTTVPRKLSTLNATSTKGYSKGNLLVTGETNYTTGIPTTPGPSPTATDLCAVNPCRNGGICREVRDKVKCYCVAPYQGEFCEKDPCTLNPCMNGGICKVNGMSFTCVCSPPYSGKLCEKDPCSENPCQNGGTCFTKGSSFECGCIEPFAGALCNADPCDWNPCKNGGVCKILNGAVKCFCMEPYTGEFCKYRAEMNGYFVPFAVVSALLFVVLISACCILRQRRNDSILELKMSEEADDTEDSKRRRKSKTFK